MTGITRRGLMATAAASLAAPALAQSERQRVLRFIPQIDLVFLDPVFSMTNITRNHAGLVFDRLYSADNALRAHPQMAEGHTIEDDGKRWTIKLREGLHYNPYMPGGSISMARVLYDEMVEYEDGIISLLLIVAGCTFPARND